MRKKISSFIKISGSIFFVALHDISLKENLKLMILLINVNSLYSYNKRDIEHLLTLTDSFTWEELPTRDPDTGYMTKAGYIPAIQRLTNYAVLFGTIFYVTQSAVRMVSNHEMIFSSWFPFDLSVTAVYVIANIMQVGSTV
jgi:hypothetical protein